MWHHELTALTCAHSCRRQHGELVRMGCVVFMQSLMQWWDSHSQQGLQRWDWLRGVKQTRGELQHADLRCW